MSDFRGLYAIRDSVDADTSFIMATFLRGLYYGDSWFSLIPKDIFMQNYKTIANALILSPNVVIKIACLKEDPNVILGYSILSADSQVVHWTFVKSAWRKQGIAKALVPQYPVFITHLSDLGRKLMSKYPTTKFNPFALT